MQASGAVTRLLLQAGADPSLTQKNGNMPIHLAASISLVGNNPDRGTEQGALGSPAIVRYLADHGAKLDVKNKPGRTPLDNVLRNREGNPETVALLRRLTGA